MRFWRFLTGSEGVAADPSFNPLLVLCSILLVSMATYAALAVAARAESSRLLFTRRAWLSLGAVVLASGLWGMHFTGMLAHRLPFATGYTLTLTLASVIPALVGSGIALTSMTHHPMSASRLHLTGLTLALGIGAMHYLGMEGISTGATMRYRFGVFAASLAAAYVLATLAVALKNTLSSRLRSGTAVRALSAIAIGVAVSGMHYTAMAAVRFIPGEGSEQVHAPVTATGLAVGVLIIVALIVSLALLGTFMDRRLAEARQLAAINAKRHRAVLATLTEGMITVAEDGRIEACNPAAAEMLGYPGQELLGISIDRILSFPEPDLTLRRPDVLTALNTAVLSSPEAHAIRRDGSRLDVELRLSLVQAGDLYVADVQLRDIGRRRATELERRRLATALEQASEAIVVSALDGRVEYVNPAFERISGYGRAEVVGHRPWFLDSQRSAALEFEEITQTLVTESRWEGELTIRTKAAQPCQVAASVSPIRDESGVPTHYVTVARDVTRQRELEGQLRQSQKLEAIGQLAAGIAHEINTPTQYVGDNVRFLREAYQDLGSVFEPLFSLARLAQADPKYAGLAGEALARFQSVDPEGLIADIPKAIDHSLEGVERIAAIVRAMKDFSHPSVDKTAVDLNRAIESTITVSTSEWRYLADIVTDLDRDLPPVPCVPGEINQVLLNLIVNAAHAIGSVVRAGEGEKGTIRVTSRLDGGDAVVTVEDTGGGIPDEIKGRIFDPFFTTKEVGKGTGQGLSLAHNVIVRKHGGSLGFDTEVGRGTSFIIRLPLDDHR